MTEGLGPVGGHEADLRVSVRSLVVNGEGHCGAVGEWAVGVAGGKAAIFGV